MGSTTPTGLLLPAEEGLRATQLRQVKEITLLVEDKDLTMEVQVVRRQEVVTAERLVVA